MALDEIEKGTISKILRLFIQDSSSTTGDGLISLTSDTVGLAAAFLREGDPDPPSGIPLVPATVGTYTSSGFVEVDSGVMPGVYEFHPPDLMLASGAESVIFFLQGAADMAPLPVEIKLTDPVTAAPTVSAIADQVWDESLGEHQLSGSMGQALAQAQDPAPTVDAIADAVWDENLGEHQLSGSMGQALAQAQDPAPTAVVIADQVWDENLNEHQLSGSMGQALGLADAIANADTIADAVWDESLGDHQLSGSMGQALAQAQDPAPVPPTAAAISDQVWDENLGEHQLSGSMGQALGLADAVANVALVWDESLIDHQLSGSMGQSLGLADTAADVNAIPGAVWDEVLTDHLTAGSMGATLSNATQTGTGNILVDHNFGGTDNLRVTDSSSGAGIDEVTIQAFLKTDFDAGNTGAAFVKGETLTGSDGRWLNPLALDADVYTISFNKPGVFVGGTQEITVS